METAKPRARFNFGQLPVRFKKRHAMEKPKLWHLDHSWPVLVSYGDGWKVETLKQWMVTPLNVVIMGWPISIDPSIHPSICSSLSYSSGSFGEWFPELWTSHHWNPWKFAPKSMAPKTVWGLADTNLHFFERLNLGERKKNTQIPFWIVKTC
jgi:hypothetical protein